MFHIACTRFNNQTYQENINYRVKTGETVIYGTAFKIRQSYSIGASIFVAEMNNETNKIEGLGLIKNLLVTDRRHKIYQINDYNRYIYSGKHWLNRDQLYQLDPDIIEILDNVLFKGKSHLKRMSGITVLTEKLFTNWEYELSDLKVKVKNAFIKYFKYGTQLDKKEEVDNEEFDCKEVDNGEDNEEDTQEFIEIIPKQKTKVKTKTKTKKIINDKR